MIGRRRKLYFEKTASKFPIIVFSISVLIGGFFLFRIISTLVRENGSTVELLPTETNSIAPTNAEEVTPQKEVAKKPTESSKSSVNKTVEKPTGTVQKEQVKTPIVSDFYTIQVATFQDKNRAEDLVVKLKGKKYSPLYIKTRGKWLEVCVGKFDSATKGKEALPKIKKDFPDAFPRKIQSPFEEK